MIDTRPIPVVTDRHPLTQVHTMIPVVVCTVGRDNIDDHTPTRRVFPAPEAAVAEGGRLGAKRAKGESLTFRLFALSDKTRQRRECIPEVIFVDGADCPHLTNFASRAHDLDPDMCSGLDPVVLVVRELGRSRVWIVLDLTRNHLSMRC